MSSRLDALTDCDEARPTGRRAQHSWSYVGGKRRITLNFRIRFHEDLAKSVAAGWDTNVASRPVINIQMRRQHRPATSFRVRPIYRDPAKPGLSLASACCSFAGRQPKILIPFAFCRIVGNASIFYIGRAQRQGLL